MVVEHAAVQVEPNQVPEFIAAFPEAQEVVQAAPGCSAVELLHDVDTPGDFIMQIHWESVEAHTEDFVTSPLFEQFKNIVSKYFKERPTVHHYTVL